MGIQVSETITENGRNGVVAHQVAKKSTSEIVESLSVSCWN